jgi:hypothetical protein
MKNPISNRIGALGLFLTLIAGGLSLSGCDSSDPAGPAGDPNAQIVILSPAGGEKLMVGETLHIKWKTQGKGLEEVNSVNIEITPDDGKTWLTLLNRSIGTEDGGWGDYPWIVLGSMARTGTYFQLFDKTNLRLRISQYSTSDANKKAVSRNFSIVLNPG